MKALKVIGILLLILILLAGIGLFIGHNYIVSDKQKEINFNDKTVKIGKVDYTIKETFPTAHISLNDVALIDSTGKTVFNLKQVNGRFNLTEWKKRKIELNAIHIDSTKILSVTKSNGENSLKGFFGSSKSNSKKKKQSNKQPFIELIADNGEVKLTNIDVEVIDSTKNNKHLKGTINSLIANVNLKEDTTIFATLDAYSDHLIFNDSKGPYLRRSKIDGPLPIVIKNGKTTIQETPITINDEIYTVGLHIYKDKPTLLTILNNESKYLKIKYLLPNHIQAALDRFQIDQTLETFTTVEFVDDINPRVEIKYNIPNNSASFQDINLQNLKAHGMFYNRLYEEEQTPIENKKNIRIDFDQLTTFFQSTKIATEDARFTYSPKFGEQIDMNTFIEGEANVISEFLKEDQFVFEEGNFKLNAYLNGSAANMKNLFLNTDLTLNMDQLGVHFVPNDVVFPIEYINMTKKGENADVELVVNIPENDNSILIRGDVIGVTSMIVNEPSPNAESKLNISSKRLDWENFVNLFGSDGYFSSSNQSQPPAQPEEENKSNLKDVLIALENRFKPEVDVEIDTLSYKNELLITDFTSYIEFENNRKLVLSETGFTIDNSPVNVDASLNFIEPYYTDYQLQLNANHLNLKEILPKADYFNMNVLKDFHSLPQNFTTELTASGRLDDRTGEIEPQRLNAELQFKNEGNYKFEGSAQLIGQMNENNEAVVQTDVNVAGNPRLVNILFENSQFEFLDGEFKLDVSYAGNPKTTKRIVETAKVDFDLTNANLLYEQTNTRLPIKELEIDFDENIANYNIDISADTVKNDITIDGQITNISNFIYENKLNTHKVVANVQSEQLDFERLLSIFPKTDTTTSGTQLKTTVREILNTFRPEVDVDVKEFIYDSDISVYDIKSGFTQNNDTLFLEPSSFAVDQGEIALEGNIYLDKIDELPFEIEFKTTDFNIGDFAKEFDYFKIDLIKDAEVLTGVVSIDADLTSSFDELNKKLISEVTRGELDFEILNIELAGIPKLDSIAEKFWVEERFDTIQLAPIKNKIQINKNYIDVPRMVINSNAFYAFVEGHRTEEKEPSFWITIPLEGVFQKELDCVPPTPNYLELGPRVYLEITSEDGETKTKFHLSKKKFFKQKGEENGYKEYKQSIRERRRELRKMRRERNKK